MKLKLDASFLLGFVPGLLVGVLLGAIGGGLLTQTSSSDSKNCMPCKQALSSIEVATPGPALGANSTLDTAARVVATPDPAASPMPVKGLDLDEVELNRKLREFAREKPARGIVLEQSTNLRGNTFLKERLQGGLVADREYNSKNILIGEKIDLPNGERLYRNFFESGAIKSVSYILRDGGQVTVVQDSTGILTNRTDLLQNGDMISYEYDDQGNCTRRFYIKKGGKGELIE